MIYRFILVKVASREEAEDITHQVFLSAWQNVRVYKHRGHPFSSWLYQIARNQVIDYYRAKKGDLSLEAIDSEFFVSPASVNGSCGEARSRESAPCVTETEAGIPGRDHLAVHRRYFSEGNRGDMKKTEGAVKFIQHRAVKELQNLQKSGATRIITNHEFVRNPAAIENDQT